MNKSPIFILLLLIFCSISNVPSARSCNRHGVCPGPNPYRSNQAK